MSKREWVVPIFDTPTSIPICHAYSRHAHFFSHRPLELDNVYNQGQVGVVNTARINWLCAHVLQVQVIVHEKEEFDFPQFNDVYGSDDVSLLYMYMYNVA